MGRQAINASVRKYLLCTLEHNNPEGAVEIYRLMNDSTKQEPMTIYLAFKLALMREDHEMASECLALLEKTASDNAEYLYACCLEAQKVNSKLCAFKGLQILVRRYPERGSDTVHLPALLRSAIRLGHQIMIEETHVEADHQALLQDICEVFEAGE